MGATYLTFIQVPSWKNLTKFPDQGSDNWCPTVASIVWFLLRPKSLYYLVWWIKALRCQTCQTGCEREFVLCWELTCYRICMKEANTISKRYVIVRWIVEIYMMFQVILNSEGVFVLYRSHGGKTVSFRHRPSQEMFDSFEAVFWLETSYPYTCKIYWNMILCYMTYVLFILFPWSFEQHTMPAGFIQICDCQHGGFGADQFRALWVWLHGKIGIYFFHHQKKKVIKVFLVMCS